MKDKLCEKCIKNGYLYSNNKMERCGLCEGKTQKEQLVNCPMTRKEFLTLDIELRRKILSRQVDKLLEETEK